MYLFTFSLATTKHYLSVYHFDVRQKFCHVSQVTDPKDERPLADIWDVNHWIALRRQERFAELFGCGNTSGLKPSKTQDGRPATNPGNSVLGGKKLGVDVGFI